MTRLIYMYLASMARCLGKGILFDLQERQSINLSKKTNLDLATEGLPTMRYWMLHTGENWWHRVLTDLGSSKRENTLHSHLRSFCGPKQIPHTFSVFYIIRIKGSSSSKFAVVNHKSAVTT